MARLFDECADSERAVDLERQRVAQREVVVLRFALGWAEHDWNAVLRRHAYLRRGRLILGAQRSQCRGIGGVGADLRMRGAEGLTDAAQRPTQRVGQRGLRVALGPALVACLCQPVSDWAVDLSSCIVQAIEPAIASLGERRARARDGRPIRAKRECLLAAIETARR